MSRDISFDLREMDLDKMSYNEIRALAKQIGVRANQKTERLKEGIRRQMIKPPPMETIEEKKSAESDLSSCNRRLRRRTFEKDEATMGALTPEILSGKKSTWQPPSMTNGDVNPFSIAVAKKELKDEVSKKHFPQPKRILKKNSVEKCKIPRPMRVTKQNKSTTVKDTPGKLQQKTPNFARIHKRNFDNMESLDDYVQKKKLRRDRLLNDCAASSHEGRKNPSIFIPTAINIREANFNFAGNVASVPKPIAAVSVSKLPVPRNQNKPNKENDHRQLFKKRGDGKNLRTKHCEYVKGVRSNKRFDLLMKMRQEQSSFNHQ